MKKFVIVYLICVFIFPSRLFAEDAGVGGFLKGFSEGFENGQKIQERKSKIKRNQIESEKAELEYYIMLDKLEKENPEAYCKFIQKKEERELKAKEKKRTLVVIGIIFCVVLIGVGVIASQP